MYPRRFSSIRYRPGKSGDLLRYTFTGRKIFEFIRSRVFHSRRKNDSMGAMRMWEEALQQKLRRLQQAVHIYSGTWRTYERPLRDFLRSIRSSFSKRGRGLALGAVGVSGYDWKQNRIPLVEMEAHRNDFDYIDQLKEHTICVPCDPTNRNAQGNPEAMCRCGKTANQSTVYEGWELFLEKEDLVVWRKPHSSGQYEYKVFGSYGDVAAEDFLNVQIDTDYRKKWDTTAIALEIGETDPDPEAHGDILYWEMLWPRLFVNRDYVFKRRYHVDKQSNTLFIMSKSTEYQRFPKYPDKFRIEDYWSCMVIRPYTDMKKAGLEFCLTYFDNPGVNIPSSVQTWVAKKAMPDFLDKLRQATKDYRSYCVADGTTDSCRAIREEERILRDKMLADKLDYCNFEWRKFQTALEEIYCRPSGGQQEREQEQQQESNGKEHRTGFWKYFYPTYYFS